MIDLTAEKIYGAIESVSLEPTLIGASVSEITENLLGEKVNRKHTVYKQVVRFVKRLEADKKLIIETKNGYASYYKIPNGSCNKLNLDLTVGETNTIVALLEFAANNAEIVEDLFEDKKYPEHLKGALKKLSVKHKNIKKK